MTDHVAWFGDMTVVYTGTDTNSPTWGWAYGWSFRAWQYRSGRPDDEVPWWSGVKLHSDGTATCMDCNLPDGYWVLAKVGDGEPTALVDDSNFTTWFRQS